MLLGQSNIDILSRAYKLNSIIQDSHKGKIQISFGGVARNIAENLVRLGIPSSLLSVVAKDALGNILMEHIKNIVPFSIDYSHVLLLDDASTSCYNAFQNEQGEMLYAIADMDIVERMNVSYFSTKKKHIENSLFCVLETNISQESLDYIVHTITGPRYVVDTVSGAKAYKVRSLIDGIFLLKTNLSELASIIKELHPSYYQDIFYFIHNDTRTHCNENDMSDAKYNTFFSLLYEIGMLLISKGLDNLVVSLGKKGLWYITKNNAMSKYEYMYIDSNYLDYYTNKKYYWCRRFFMCWYSVCFI